LAQFYQPFRQSISGLILRILVTHDHLRNADNYLQLVYSRIKVVIDHQYLGGNHKFSAFYK